MAATPTRSLSKTAASNPVDGDSPNHYVGRFAPSPSGPLHFGSLIGALASYCDARAQGGEWLVRMEDLDPPREVPGAADAILKTLEAHGLLWDRAVLYQSQRTAAYQQALEALVQKNLTYPCYCTRKVLQKEGPVYRRHCLSRDNIGRSDKPAAIRIKTPSALISRKLTSTTLTSTKVATTVDDDIVFDDVFFGRQRFHLDKEVGDFIIKRKDGLFAYQLAVVVDDCEQGITHVIRGSDLLDSTPAQIHLQHCLEMPTPTYGHVPVATNSRGQKLSKQHHAKGLDNNLATENLWLCLAFLHQRPPADARHGSVAEILHWAVAHWDRSAIPNTMAIAVDESHQLRDQELAENESGWGISQ